jgi:hypothetical protein
MTFLNQSNYQNQLNINVLGHIFEQSISDIEEIKSRLQSEEPLLKVSMKVPRKPSCRVKAQSKWRIL